MNVKPAVGFTLPSAGVTPAPSGKKSRNVEDDVSLSGSGGLGANTGDGPNFIGTRSEQRRNLESRAEENRALCKDPYLRSSPILIGDLCITRRDALPLSRRERI